MANLNSSLNFGDQYNILMKPKFIHNSGQHYLQLCNFYFNLFLKTLKTISKGENPPHHHLPQQSE